LDIIDDLFMIIKNRFVLKSTLLISIMLMATSLFALSPDLHVKWSFSANKINDCEYDLLLKAQIDKGYHLYSQIETLDGPLPTLFKFDKSDEYELIGTTIEPKPIEKAEPVFDNQVLRYFETTVTFKQRIKVKSSSNFSITGAIDGMVCNEGSCVNFFPSPTFSIQISGANCTGTVTTPVETVIPETPTITAKDTTTKVVEQTPTPVTPNNSNEDGEEKDNSNGTSLWAAFLGGLAGGLIALLTPCVFPMIPMTVSFFTKRARTRKQGIRDALIYALSIIVIYVSLGLLVTLVSGNAMALNQLSANIWFNLAFFLIFLIFGISFLGAFEITLPSAFVNKIDKASDKGGLMGIFFMAFTLSLVSFSCTGPIVGTALVQALSIGITGPLFVMFGFSLALALPFALFAMFPGWLNSLPKSGGWLNSIKVVLGLLEFALALKFLSNVDLAYHWGIITREVFLAVWIVCFSIIGFYLLGKLKFAHDSGELNYISVPRIIIAILTFSFVIYMLPGIWGAPVRVLSGILPPAYYSENASYFSKHENSVAIEGVNQEECPLQLNCFKDYKLALDYAKKQGKPLIVDFTGYNCANCRRMEDNVWPDPSVINQLRNDYVIVSLYCDDKKELPENLKYKTKDGISIETWGHKWSQLQIDKYGSNAQPLYILLDTNEKMLTDSAYGYTPVDKYASYLRAGSTEFKKRLSKDSTK
jgi:thiol:disulfide interchange protein